jgi:hypothetical protein
MNPSDPTHPSDPVPMPPAPAPHRHKPGIQTTEFWITLLIVIAGAIPVSGLVPDDGTAVKICGLVISVLSGMGYVNGRAKLKANLLPILCIGLAIPFLSGCVAAIKQGDIISVKTRTVGLKFGQSPSTQTPEMEFGLITTVVQFVPTSTNGPIFAPKYFDTFAIDSTWNPLKTGILENSGFGDVSIMTNAQGKAIIPAPGAPAKPAAP